MLLINERKSILFYSTFELRLFDSSTIITPMPNTIDDLRSQVKTMIDDTSYKGEGLNFWSITVSAAGIIIPIVNCNRNTIFNSFSQIALLCSIIILIGYPIANLVYYLDCRDLIRKDNPRISTYFPNPFISDNLVKVFVGLIILLTYFSFGNQYIGKWETNLCIAIVSFFITLELFSIVVKKKHKQELIPLHGAMLFAQFILVITALCLILPGFTIVLEFDLIVFSICIIAELCIVYYFSYVFFLSPKTQLSIKLRACYNRLCSREYLNFEDEYKSFQKIVNGVFLGELFDHDFSNLFAQRELIIQNCSKAYDILDFKNDYTVATIERIHLASNLLNKIYRAFDLLIIDVQSIVDRLNGEYNRLERNSDDYEQVLCVLNEIANFRNCIFSDIKTLNLVIDLCSIRLEELNRYYENHPNCFCKYAPYKKRFGHFIGCRIIPRIDKLFGKYKGNNCT